METTIPFSGFYYSLHSDQLDRALESAVSDSTGCHTCTALLDLANDSVDWAEAHRMYAKKFVQKVASRYDLAIKFVDLVSPKFYNFQTDRIFCQIELDEVKRIFAAVDKAELQAKIKRCFTSCDGFISHYPNDLAKWPEDLAEWDHNQVGTLIAVYIEAEDADFEAYVAEDLEPYAILDAAIKDPRPFNIAAYLRSREERHHRR